jgi:hypothetical protein
MRYAIFKENLDLIEQHNQDFLNGKYTYRLGVNVDIFYFVLFLFNLEFKLNLSHVERNMPIGHLKNLKMHF